MRVWCLWVRVHGYVYVCVWAHVCVCGYVRLCVWVRVWCECANVCVGE